MAQAEAEAMAALGIEERGAVVITAAEGWHPGVVGLVAARLKEKFGRPAFAIALEPGGIGTGSGRSIAGVDIGRAVRRAVAEGLLLKGGGHAMAAGVTLRKARWRSCAPFSKRRSPPMSRRHGAPAGSLIDGAVSAAGPTAELVAMIDRAGPFGCRQSGADHRAAGAHGDLCGGSRPGARAGAAQIRRRRRRQCHRLPRRRPETRRRAAEQPRPASPCRRLASRSTAGKARSACSSGSPISRRQSRSAGGEPDERLDGLSPGAVGRIFRRRAAPERVCEITNFA